MQRESHAPAGYLAFLGRKALGAGAATRLRTGIPLSREPDTTHPAASSRGIGLGIVLGLLAWCAIITTVVLAI